MKKKEQNKISSNSLDINANNPMTRHFTYKIKTRVEVSFALCHSMEASNSATYIRFLPLSTEKVISDVMTNSTNKCSVQMNASRFEIAE